ncbi:MAG: hypothetical protein U5K53_08500 [Halanaerobiales bacterium]|nr:hypothetical protein [Halanaerobiales bacterium]
MKKIVNYIRKKKKISLTRDNIITIIWLFIFAVIITILSLPNTREKFVYATNTHPYLMGILELGILGTMGDLLGAKIVKGKWEVMGIKIHQRILVWGFIGILFTVAFPIYSYGVEGLLKKSYLPGKNSALLTSFWKSFLMNTLFAFPMMVTNRFLNKLIDDNNLFTIWPVVDTFKKMPWEHMFRMVAPTCLWFWIPVNTITFLLPSEFRVISGALLAIALGFILGMAKKLSLQKN